MRQCLDAGCWNTSVAMQYVRTWRVWAFWGVSASGHTWPQKHIESSGFAVSTWLDMMRVNHFGGLWRWHCFPGHPYMPWWGHWWNPAAWGCRSSVLQVEQMHAMHDVYRCFGWPWCLVLKNGEQICAHLHRVPQGPEWMLLKIAPIYLSILVVNPFTALSYELPLQVKYA